MMTLPHVHKTERETELRFEASRRATGACEVLADFYEAEGQHTRADLWRRTINGERDLLIKQHDNIHPVDPRRNAMIWLLMNQRRPDERPRSGRSSFTSAMLQDVADLFQLSTSMIRHIVTQHDRMIREAATSECAKPTMKATHRLIEAGALRAPTEIIPRKISYDIYAGADGGIATRAEAEAAGRVQQIGHAIDALTMTIKFSDGWAESALYLNEIDLPPETWPHTKCVGIMGPKRIQIGTVQRYGNQ
jgi:hypothetical protein